MSRGVLAAAVMAFALIGQYQTARMQEIAPRIAGDTSTLAAKGLLATTDEEFLRYAVRAGALEVQTARVAIARTTNAEVKALAEKLVNDHAATTRELTQWATKKNVVLKEDDPDLKMKLDKHKSLETKTGADFDRAFLDATIDDHFDTIILFSNEVLRTRDDALRTFAEETRAAIRAHLNLARALRAKVDCDLGRNACSTVNPRLRH